MDLARIRELLAIVAQSGVAEVEIEEDDFRLVVRRHASTVTVQAPPGYAPYGMNFAPPMPAYAPPAAPMPAYAAAPAAPVAEAPASSNNAAPPAPAAPPVAEVPAEEGVLVRAPIVGTYYEAPAPDAEPFVQVGSTVKPGDVLCIIEAMKLMNEIENEVAGVVRKILVENGEPVEYDQPLFLIEAT